MVYKISFCLGSILLVSTSVFSQNPNKKVVYIIVDGIAEDMLEKTTIPHLKKIEENGVRLKAYVGGDKNQFNETPTISAVGYNSLLTGTWVNKHEVFANYNQNPNYNYPTIFKLFKEKYPNKNTAVFSTWKDNRTVLIGEGLDETGNLKMDYAFDGMEKDTINFPHKNQNSQHIRDIDSVVAKKASEYIVKEGPNLSWVYLQFSDDIGHRHGNSPELYDAITFEDKLVGQIYESVQKRKGDYDEEWLFIVTTDHGRQKDGYGHGGQSDRERHTWIYMNTPIINDYAQKNRVAITDLFPTIANFLNIKLPKAIAQEQDGIPLLTAVNAYDLKGTLTRFNHLELSWKTLNPRQENAKIYITPTNNFKEGRKDNYTFLGEVKLKKRKFKTKLNLPESELYKVVFKTDSGILNTWITL